MRYVQYCVKTKRTLPSPIHLDLDIKDGLFNLTMLEVELAKLVTATDSTAKDIYYEMNAAAMFPTGQSLKVKAKARIDSGATNFVVVIEYCHYCERLSPKNV
jgi:hypothetical protein